MGICPNTNKACETRLMSKQQNKLLNDVKEKAEASEINIVQLSETLISVHDRIGKHKEELKESIDELKGEVKQYNETAYKVDLNTEFITELKRGKNDLVTGVVRALMISFLLFISGMLWKVFVIIQAK